jgi:hypothetical protein
MGRTGLLCIMRQAGMIAGSVLLLTWTIAWGEPATITSDRKFVDGLVADLGFQPRRVIERVRYFANIPSEAPMQRRLSSCVEGYANRFATDIKLREKVANEVDQRTCERFQLCPRKGLKRIDQSPVYVELLRVLAREMRGEKLAESNQTFMEHEAFVEFGRRLARLRGVEEAFSQASTANGEISGPYILASCPYAWNSWPILASGLIAICLLVGVFGVVYKRKLKPTPSIRACPRS